MESISLDELLGLDFKTMVFMAVVLTLMLSVLLCFARLNSKGIRGLGFWAMGNLSLSLGMFAIVTLFDSPAWLKIPSTALIALGTGFYVNGIQAFLERKPNLQLTIGMTAIVIIVDGFLLLSAQNIRLTVFFNAFVYMSANLYCAYLLLKASSRPLSNAYVFTGAVFAIMSGILAFRAMGALQADKSVFLAMSDWSINKITFLWGSILQLCTTFGFVLMLNHRMAERLQTLVAHDWLTGALTRRYLEDSAQRLQASCEYYNVGMSVLMIDLDLFKEINDQHGHQAGDEVLKQFSEMMRSIIRAEDLFGRYGGEEFCVLLPNTTERQATEFAERIRKTFANRVVVYRGRKMQCTVSIGVCDSAVVGMLFKDLLAAADKCLYTAKISGRNRVISFSETSQPLPGGFGGSPVVE